jgi:hypothetical protein
MAENRCSEDLPPRWTLRIMFAADPAKEGRQGAQLLERRREPSPRDRPSCATPRPVSGRDQPVPGRGLAQIHRSFRRGRRTFADPGAVSRGCTTAAASDNSVVQLRPSDMRLCRPRQWGACWLTGQLGSELQLDRFWARPAQGSVRRSRMEWLGEGDRLPASRKRTRRDQVLQVLV